LLFKFTHNLYNLSWIYVVDCNSFHDQRNIHMVST
jgi:hypothetical protein